jgi:hypothetical protein
MRPKPTVTLPDPERITIDAFVAAGRTGVSVRYPSSTLTGTNTRVQVELESSSVIRYPIMERANLRVVAHAAPGKRDEVKALAATLLADLYVHPGNASVAGFVPLSGRSGVVTDPTTRNEMCWFLVRADLFATTV